MLSKVMLLTGLMVSLGPYAGASGTVSVPEPESISMIAIGIGLIGVIVSKKK